MLGLNLSWPVVVTEGGEPITVIMLKTLVSSVFKVNQLEFQMFVNRNFICTLRGNTDKRDRLRLVVLYHYWISKIIIQGNIAHSSP